jgi:hypothetical protein
VAHPHHILLNREEKKNVADVVGFIKSMIALIHLKPPPPTLNLTNHVPIIKFMGMM